MGEEDFVDEVASGPVLEEGQAVIKELLALGLGVVLGVGACLLLCGGRKAVDESAGRSDDEMRHKKKGGKKC